MDEKTIIEIKDVRYQARTKQLQGEYKAAKDSGRDFWLFIEENTRLSEPVRKIKDKKFHIFEYKRPNP